MRFPEITHRAGSALCGYPLHADRTDFSRVCVPAPELSSAAEPDAIPEIHEAPLDTTSCWKSAIIMLQNRDWHTETIIHLWLQPVYVQGSMF